MVGTIGEEGKPCHDNAAFAFMDSGRKSKVP
jgi:hypothetical protein